MVQTPVAVPFLSPLVVVQKHTEKFNKDSGVSGLETQI